MNRGRDSYILVMFWILEGLGPLIVQRLKVRALAGKQPAVVCELVELQLVCNISTTGPG